MHNNDRKKREVRPLGVFALIMAIIYSIPIVLMFFVDNPVIRLIGFAAIPITIISYATAKMNFWKTPATNIRISYYGQRLLHTGKLLIWEARILQTISD